MPVFLSKKAVIKNYEYLLNNIFTKEIFLKEYSSFISDRKSASKTEKFNLIFLGSFTFP